MNEAQYVLYVISHIWNYPLSFCFSIIMIIKMRTSIIAMSFALTT